MKVKPVCSIFCFLYTHKLRVLKSFCLLNSLKQKMGPHVSDQRITISVLL